MSMTAYEERLALLREYLGEAEASRLRAEEEEKPLSVGVRDARERIARLNAVAKERRARDKEDTAAKEAHLEVSVAAFDMRRAARLLAADGGTAEPRLWRLRRHVVRLNRAGVGQQRIADLAGVTRAAVRLFMSSRPELGFVKHAFVGGRRGAARGAGGDALGTPRG